MSAAVIAIRRKRLVRKFREARATDQEHAITLESVGERPGWIFRQMAQAGVFVITEAGRYYLDEAAAAEFLRSRLIRALAFTALMLVVVVILWLTGVLR